MAVQVLMYGSENLAINRSDTQKTESIEMRFLRPTVGHTYPHGSGEKLTYICRRNYDLEK
jgi:hypothetical protein